MISKLNPVILEPTKGNICLVAALVYRKGKAYVSIRGVVEGEPPALGLVTGRTIREDPRGDLSTRHQSVRTKSLGAVDCRY